MSYVPHWHGSTSRWSSVRRQTAPEAQKALNRIEKEVIQLNEMIGQVLTLSRLQSGIQGIQIAPVDLERLVQEVAADAHFEAQASDRIVRLVESVECTVSGNKELLRRAIENVVRNAVHYTRENSSVEIRLRRTMNNDISFAEISVRDHGLGVPEADASPFVPSVLQGFKRPGTPDGGHRAWPCHYRPGRASFTTAP